MSLKKNCILSMVIGVFSVSSIVLGQPKSDPERLQLLAGGARVVNCPLVKAPPVLDGKLDDDCWTKAGKLSDFLLIQGKGFAKEQTIGRVCYDRKNLYIAAILYESKIKDIRKKQTVRNSSVWSDDCLEVFIDPEKRQTKTGYYQFIVNPIGTQCDNLLSKIDQPEMASSKRADWKAKTRIEADCWIVEMAIPLDLFGRCKPKLAAQWGFNICREEKPHDELSYWNNTGTLFVEPVGFGTISFGDQPVSLDAVSLSKDKRNILVQINSKYATDVDLSYKAMSGKKEIASHSRKLNLQPGETLIYLPLLLKKSQDCLVNLSVSRAGKILSNITLPMKKDQTWLVSAAWPAEDRNNRLPIAMNTIQHCFIVLANHSRKTIATPNVIISLPEGIELLNPIGPVRNSYSKYNPTRWTKVDESRNGEKYTRHTITLGADIKPGRIEKQSRLETLPLFFQVDSRILKPGQLLKAYYHLEANGESEPEHEIEIPILPAVNGRQPKELITHLWMCSQPTISQDVWAPLMKTYKTVGFTAIDSRSNSLGEKGRMRKRAGIKAITNFWWLFWASNDFAKAHPDYVSRDFSGKIGKSEWMTFLCPTKLVENDGALMKEILKGRFKDIKSGEVDGYELDLEHPKCWKICFCKRCLTAFRKREGISANEKLTPQIIREKYRMQWLKFCCSQTALVAKYFRQMVHEANPKAVFAAYSGNQSVWTMEQYRVNWEDLSPGVDYACLGYYSANPGALDVHMNEGMKKNIRNIKKWASGPVKVIPTLTVGYGRNGDVNPSAPLHKIQLLRTFASGADGVSIWRWDKYDGEYYTAFAEAIAQVCDFEDFFLRGKRNPGLLKLRNPYGKNLSAETIELDGCALVMIFNNSPSSTRKVKFKQARPGSNAVGYSYPAWEKFNPSTMQEVELKPLEVKTFIFGPRAKIESLIMDIQDQKGL